MRYLLSRTSLKLIGLIFSMLLFVGFFIASIALGKTAISLQTTYDAFFHFDESMTEHVIVRTSRLTRTVIAAVIGCSLALAGALMQALTRNPLAAPDIFGINAGALFFIVVAVTFFNVNSMVGYMWIAFVGAGVAAMLVYFLGSLGKDGLSPVKIVLAGAAISALFISFAQGLLVIDEQKIQTVLFWLAGSVAGRNMDMLLSVLPFIAGAIVLTLFLGKGINILLLGDDVAKGLGQKTVVIKVLMGIMVVFLAGGSVAVAGSIGFIGLIVPHMARGLVGSDYRWVIPYSALLGATLMIVADIGARFIIMPQDMPIGVMTAFMGVPFFIYIARRGLAKK